MRRLKTLLRDKQACAEVAKAASQKQSGDNMDFGLLCYERGRMSMFDPASKAHIESLLNGYPDYFGRYLRRILKLPHKPLPPKTEDE